MHQTLRFVKSLPKRERQPLRNKFKNADDSGMRWISFVFYDTEKLFLTQTHSH